MAKTSMIEREKRRAKSATKHAAKRKKLKALIADPKVGSDEKQTAVEALARMPRDSSPIRARNRCSITGRSRGVYRKFGLGRNKLREATMRGDIPGLRKSSW
jgi:small subunit ribosomal protein S14